MATATVRAQHSSEPLGQKPLSFYDLPPELRQLTYSFALLEEGPIPLFSQSSKAALALGQVSRSVRAESTCAYYTENTFRYISGTKLSDLDAPLSPLILRWAATWGVRGEPYVRSLKVACLWLMVDSFYISIELDNSVKPVKRRPGYFDSDAPFLMVQDVNALVLAVLHPKGELNITNSRLLAVLEVTHSTLCRWARGKGLRRSSRSSLRSFRRRYDTVVRIGEEGLFLIKLT